MMKKSIIKQKFNNIMENEKISMKIKMKKIVATMFLLTMVFSLQKFATFASSDSGTVKMAKNQVMTQAETGISRTKRYGYAEIAVNSVYPTGTYTEDNYTKCQTCLYHYSLDNVQISDIYTLTEGDAAERVKIKDGYLNVTYFDLCFAGNNPNYDAYVTYTYNGK